MGSKAEPHVTMRVRVGDSEVEVTGPSGFVEAKIADFLNRHRREPAPPSATSLPASGPASPAGGKSMSVAQFFRKVAPKTDVDRTLAAGYYLEYIANLESFTAADVRETIRGAKIPPPRNPSDAVAKNIKKGLMMGAGDKDGKMAFVVTTDGEEAVRALLAE